MPSYDQNQLLSIIDQASFAMDDVLLFLDTHPCDQGALNYYQYVSKMRREAKEAYEASYGPLTVDHVHSNQYWTWVQGKWPWEGGNSTCGTMKSGCNTR
ncbi:MAG: spore coat protein CotJB [Hungatella sp.]|nr:spore coat protein CotJB [Hungatella sp.]